MTTFTELIEAAKTSVELYVAKYGQDRMIPPYVWGLRNGEQVVKTVLQDVDGLGKPVEVMIHGMALDTVVIAVDTLGTALMENPITEAPWEKGDLMIIDRDYPDARKRGWIIDMYGMFLSTKNPAENEIWSCDYSVKDGVVTWANGKHTLTSSSPVSGQPILYTEELNKPTMRVTLAEKFGEEFATNMEDAWAVSRGLGDEQKLDRELFVLTMYDLVTANMLVQSENVVAMMVSEVLDGKNRSQLVRTLGEKLAEKPPFGTENGSRMKMMTVEELELKVKEAEGAQA